jgi:uncharacterized protein
VTRAVVPAAGGLVMALGLGLGGMTRPQKVLGFLDFTGTWDPSLLFVMMGAVAVYGLVFHALRRSRLIPAARNFNAAKGAIVNGRLLLGAGIFGVGWGLSGICPGPAVVVATTGTAPLLVFAGGMLVGMAAVSYGTARAAWAGGEPREPSQTDMYPPDPP